MRSILEQIKAINGGSIIDKGQMLWKIHQVLMRKSCFNVIDDVWQIDLDWWTRVCFARSQSAGGKSSCPIITTRLENAAIRMGVDTSHIHVCILWKQR